MLLQGYGLVDIAWLINVGLFQALIMVRLGLGLVCIGDLFGIVLVMCQAKSFGHGCMENIMYGIGYLDL